MHRVDCLDAALAFEFIHWALRRAVDRCVPNSGYLPHRYRRRVHREGPWCRDGALPKHAGKVCVFRVCCLCGSWACACSACACHLCGSIAPIDRRMQESVFRWEEKSEDTYLRSCVRERSEGCLRRDSAHLALSLSRGAEVSPTPHSSGTV